jgi:hypothetical protein
MFSPGHLLAHLIREGQAHHTASGSVVKTVRCEACDWQYHYRLSREAEGFSQSFLVPNHQAAEQKASELVWCGVVLDQVRAAVQLRGGGPDGVAPAGQRRVGILA